LQNHGGIARLDACSFEAFYDVPAREGGVVGVPEQQEKVRFLDREESFTALKVVCEFDSIRSLKWPEQHHIERLQTVN
jgi:hypothetical protein